MDKLLSRVAYAIVPVAFLVGAYFFFKQDSPIAGGVCIVVAFLCARN